MHLVDLSPVYQQLNEALLTVLSGLALWLAAYAKQWLAAHARLLGEQTDTELANGLNRALQNGVAIAMQNAEELEKRYPGMPVKGQVAAWAAQYAVDHSPGAMQRFAGMTANDLAIKALAYLPPVVETTDASGAVVNSSVVKTLPLADAHV